MGGTITICCADGSPAPTPTPTSSTTATPTPTPTPSTSSAPSADYYLATNVAANDRFIFTPQTSFTDVAFTIVMNSQQSPAGPAAFSNSHVTGAMQSITGTNDPYVYTGIYRFTPIISASSQFNGDAPTTAAVGIQNLTSRWYYTFEAPAPTPTPTSSTTATPTPTPSSSEVIEPTPTPTPSSSEPSNGGRFFTNTGETKGADSSGNCLATEFSIFADNDVFASVANAVVGDRFYADLGLLNPWQGANKWYTVTDNSGAGVPLIDRKEFKIDNNGKILEIH
jgi:hypothetical protein